MTRHLVFVDCETNGTDPARHRAWEVAYWNLTTGARGYFLPYLGDVPTFLAQADRKALRVSGFIDRWDDLVSPGRNGEPAPHPYGARETATAVSEFVEATCPPNWRDYSRNPADTAPRLIGSKPTFDMDFLAPLFADIGPAWYHHPVDLGSYAAGVLGLDILDAGQSLSAAAVAELCGVEPGGHTAEGDVTSGGRCVLLLREAARQAQQRGIPAHAWLRKQPLRGDMIERELLVPAPVVSTQQADPDEVVGNAGSSW